MAICKNIIVTESIEELRKALKNSIPFISPRIKMLIEMKKYQDKGISRRVLADHIGVDPNSVQSWRSMYEQGGLGLLCSHNRKGSGSSVFTLEEHQLIEQKLNDPQNGLKGYTELLDWVEQEFSKQIKYNTLLKYCRRNFGSRVKVARKSHVNKDAQAVETFKKTSLRPVLMS